MHATPRFPIEIAVSKLFSPKYSQFNFRDSAKIYFDSSAFFALKYAEPKIFRILPRLLFLLPYTFIFISRAFSNFFIASSYF